MDIDGKDAVLGILVIAVVGLAGGLGFVMISNPGGTQIITQCPEVDYLYGLPDDWNIAPNSSYFTLNNGTDSITIYLSDILEGAKKFLDGCEEWEKCLAVQTVKDDLSGLWITGVDVLDVLAYYDTNFAGDLTFTSLEDNYGATDVLETSAYDLVGKMYEDDEPVIIGIAANKTWLEASPIGSQCGNFSLFGQAMETSCKRLETIDVLNNWTVDVKVNGVVNITLGPENLTSGIIPIDYSYIGTGWFNYNRTYWGTNISDIISYTGVDAYANFGVQFVASDGYKLPNPYSYRSPEALYNKTEVMDHLPHNGTHIIALGNHTDNVNGTGKNPSDGIPIAATDLRMCLVFADRELSEGFYGDPDPVWPNRRFCGYRGGPYQLVVPGRIKARYLEHIKEIRITVPYP